MYQHYFPPVFVLCIKLFIRFYIDIYHHVKHLCFVSFSTDMLMYASSRPDFDVSYHSQWRLKYEKIVENVHNIYHHVNHLCFVLFSTDVLMYASLQPDFDVRNHSQWRLKYKKNRRECT